MNFRKKLIAISSNVVDGDLPQDVIDPRVTNIYAPYKLQTPSKVTGSFAYVFLELQLLSIDYIKTTETPNSSLENDSYFNSLNANIMAPSKIIQVN
jgi:hypothetical protein